MFQCSSASRKFLNLVTTALLQARTLLGFSALQRAENSSMLSVGRATGARPRFSALQRAENSSMVWMFAQRPTDAEVSVLFSEPKIPQFGRCPDTTLTLCTVSVLFSEPKIPQ